MYVLVGEIPGESMDFYPRQTFPVRVSESREKLEAWWRLLPKPRLKDMPLSAYPDDGDDPRTVELDGRDIHCIGMSILEVPVLS